MGWKDFLISIIAIFLVIFLFFYWVFPFQTIDFSFSPKNSNFSLNSSINESMQFYPDMRYPDKDISYSIRDCTIQKEDYLKGAFDIIENLTVLNFYPVDSNEQISVTCDEKAKFEGDLLIAGEGGPSNFTRTDNFNVINHGVVTLLKEPSCEKPNVAIHEILHALGFAHSENPNNIMYYATKCSQTIGQDIPEAIDQLYSFPSLPDLTFENVSASMSGRYLDLYIIIRNNGLENSPGGTINVYADGDSIKEINFEPIKIGSGRIITITNIFVLQKSIDELKFVINSDFEELDKGNNEAILNYNS